MILLTLFILYYEEVEGEDEGELLAGEEVVVKEEAAEKVEEVDEVVVKKK